MLRRGENVTSSSLSSSEDEEEDTRERRECFFLSPAPLGLGAALSFFESFFHRIPNLGSFENGLCTFQVEDGPAFPEVKERCLRYLCHIPHFIIQYGSCYLGWGHPLVSLFRYPGFLAGRYLAELVPYLGETASGGEVAAAPTVFLG